MLVLDSSVDIDVRELSGVRTQFQRTEAVVRRDHRTTLSDGQQGYRRAIE